MGQSFLPVLNAVRSVLHHLLNILVEEKLQHQRHVVTIQKKLSQELELEHIYSQGSPC